MGTCCTLLSTRQQSKGYVQFLSLAFTCQSYLLLLCLILPITETCDSSTNSWACSVLVNMGANLPASPAALHLPPDSNGYSGRLRGKFLKL